MFKMFVKLYQAVGLVRPLDWIIGTSILGNSPWVIGIIIVSGILSLVLFKYFIITATSMWGAILLTGSLSLFALPSFSQRPYFLEIMETALFLSGLLYQAVHLKKLGKSGGVMQGDKKSHSIYGVDFWHLACYIANKAGRMFYGDKSRQVWKSCNT